MSSLVPPKRLAHWKAPVAEYLATKMSEPPALVRPPPPKFTVPWKDPAITRFPLPSVATASPRSSPVPPKPFAHGPPLTGQPGVLLLAVVLMADALPALSTALTA